MKCTEKFSTADVIKKSESTILKLVLSRVFDRINDESIKHLEPFLDSNGVIQIKSKILFREHVELETILGSKKVGKKTEHKSL